MRRLIVQAFVSLDGVMQGPGGPEEDPTGGFTHGGWAANYWDEEMLRGMENPDPPYELLLGRGTYEIFAAHWPYAEGPTADAPESHTQVRRVDDAGDRRLEQQHADRRRRTRGRRSAQAQRTDPRSRSTAASG